MKEKIKDIKVLQPEDKLIILFDDGLSRMEFERIKKFTDSKHRILALSKSSFKVFILKKGAKLELKKVLNEKLA